ncbi:MAG: hypothetical protein ABJG78_14085 [Cyclobacteriaceae bacterium]
MRRFAGIAFLKLGLSSSLLLAIQTQAQDIPVGTWRTHFSYQSVQILEKTSDKIFCAAKNGLFSVDFSDNSTRKLSKIDGLSDVGVSSLHFNQAENVLAIGYRSGSVDFVFESNIVTLKEIANSGLEGEKKINDIAVYESSTLLATGLGIVVVDNGATVIKENFTQIGPGGVEVAATEIEILGNTLFAKTGEGLQNGDLNSNLLDFNNWTHHATTTDLENLTTVGSELYANRNLDLFQFENNAWIDTGVDLPASASKLHTADGKLLTVANQSIFELSGGQFTAIASSASTLVNDVESVNGSYWLADDVLGLITSEGTPLSPKGPLHDQYSRFRTINNSVYGFHAPPIDGYDGSIKVEGYSVFEEGEWTIREIEGFRNVSDIAQFEGVTYFSSIGDGLFNQSNSEIVKDIPQSDTSSDTVISAMESKKDLWLASFGNTNPIHRFDGQQWVSYSSALLLDDEYLDISTSETGVFWGRTNDGRMVVFNPGENRTLNLTGLPGQLQNFEISIEDDVWIATSDGPAMYADASFIFESTEIILPTFESSVLFENEQINAIETDGGNRVWFATERGLWIFNENTSEQVAMFDINNSPIPSNKVSGLAYSPSNGEMFITTDKGMISYRSASSTGSRSHSNVNVFPNPVPPNYEGLIGIEGLAKNTFIKITDLNGNLVKELKANGSSASWDLRNLGNQEVVTGVYLIFSSTQDGLETYVGKIAIIR